MQNKYTVSSLNWIKRQNKDQYFLKSKTERYASRSAYKLIEINQKFSILMPGITVIDLGAAPGGWSQVANKEINVDENNQGKLYAVDIKKFNHAENIIAIQEDCSNTIKICEKINNKAHLIMSDISPNFCGDKKTDKIRMACLCEDILKITKNLLLPKGNFIIKTFYGSNDQNFTKNLKNYFKTIHYYKPPASRKESAEIYIIALCFTNNNK